MATILRRFLPIRAPSMGKTVPPASYSPDYASWPRRVLGSLDGFALATVVFTFLNIVTGGAPLLQIPFVIAVAVGWLWRVFWHRVLGSTPTEGVVDVKVVHELTELPLRLMQCIWRETMFCNAWLAVGVVASQQTGLGNLLTIIVTPLLVLRSVTMPDPAPGKRWQLTHRLAPFAPYVVLILTGLPAVAGEQELMVVAAVFLFLIGFSLKDGRVAELPPAPPLKLSPTALSKQGAHDRLAPCIVVRRRERLSTFAAAAGAATVRLFRRPAPGP